MSFKKLFLIFLMMLALFLGTLYAIFYYDIGGTQKYIKDVPILNKIVPIKEDLDGIEEELNSYSHNKLLKYTLSLYRQNEINKKEVESLKEEVIKWSGEDGKVIKENYEKMNKELNDALDEIIRLKEYETEYVKLKEAKESQDKAIAVDNTKTYRDYFETLYANEAKEIYELVVEQEKYDKDFANYISAFSEMDTKKAALVIEQLARTDFDVVIKIVNSLEADVASDILSEVDTAYASMITKSISSKKVVSD